MASFPEKHYLDDSSSKMDPDLEAALKERPRSCSAVGSDASSNSSQGRCRPMSTGGSGHHSRTLVQPRPWRFLQKSRLGSSLERERATEEDTLLEGDDDDRKSEEEDDELGSSVDGDLMVMRRKRKEEEEEGGRKGGGTGEGAGSPVDGVVRTKSDSDIAVKKELVGNGDAPRLVVFKSKAERFSRKDNKMAVRQTTPSPSSSSKSHTLPLSLPPQLLAAAAGSPGIPAQKSATLPASSAPIARLAEVTSSADRLSDKEAKLKEVCPPAPEPTVNRSEDRRHSLDDRRLADDRRNVSRSEVTGVSPIASDRPASVWDSPTRSITLNMQDSSPSVAFSKSPPQHVQLYTPPPSSDPQKTSTPKSPEKPKVPTKPARKNSLKSASPVREGNVSSSTSPSRAGPPKPPRTSLDQNRRSSSSLGSPKSPEETVLFSMGFTVLDDEHKPSVPKQNRNGIQDLRPKSKPDTFQFPQKKDETVAGNEPVVGNKDVSPSVQNETKPETYSEQDIADALKEVAEPHRDSERTSQPNGDRETDAEPKEPEIVAKKMTKIKGDKKAEEKASKAKKKEQKAKEKEMKSKEKELKAREKEAKAKLKAAAKDDKGRVKLFPWKVEFSAKDKGHSGDAEDAPGLTGDNRTAEDAGQKMLTTALPVEPNPPFAVSETDSLYLAAGTGHRRMGDRADGEGSKSPSEMSSSQEASPSTPPSSSSSPQEEEKGVPSPHQDELLQQQQQQQLHRVSPGRSSKKQSQQASPSSPSNTPEDLPSHEPEPSDPVAAAAGATAAAAVVAASLSSSPLLQPDSHQQQHQQPVVQHQSPQRQRQGAADAPQWSPQSKRQAENSQPSPEVRRHRETAVALARPRERLATGEGGGEDVPLRSSYSLPGSPAHHPREDLSSSDPGSSDLDSLSGTSSQRPRRSRQGRAPPTSQSLRLRVTESDGEATSPDGEGQGRRLQGAPRRHTVGGAQVRDEMGTRTKDDNERKREAFYELLATRYPQYADKITMATHQPSTAAERNPRPREPQRRRTTVATYNPQSTHLLDHEDAGTMSDVEPSSFQRGGIARASLPIVRSASSSLERPIGLVFLVFGDETKKSLLPNEITSLDTVRALFVRAFPDKLSMEFLDSPKRKIYILEATTNIFFQLEDLRDIQDRTVLKIHECDSDEPQHVRSLPESRGRVQQVAVPSRPSSRQGYASDTGIHYDMAKVQSLPMGQAYQEMMQRERAQWEMEQEYIHAQQQQQRRSRSRSQTPELAERPRSLSTGAPRNRYSHSPDRMSNPERAPPPPPQPHSLGPIPENPRLLANGFRQAALNQNGSHYEVLPGRVGAHPHPHPHPGAPPSGRVLSPPTVGHQPIYESVYQPGGGGGYHHPQAYVTHSMRTAPPQGPQRATGPPPPPDIRGGNRNDPAGRHSLAFAAMSNPIYESFPQRAQSYRSTPERDAVPPRPHSTTPHDVNRMERMEAQIASLAAWVHHVHASPTDPTHRRGPGSSRSLSDIPASYSVRQPVLTGDMREKMNDMQCRLQELRVELQGLKRMEQLNQEAMRDAFSDTLVKIKKVMGSSGKSDNIYGELLQLSCSMPLDVYLRDKARVEHDLRGLENKVEGVKEEVLNRRTPVNVKDIEGQAVQLSHITKSIADLRARCPQVHEALKNASSGGARNTNEEQFLREEPVYIESALKRCKALTNNLATLKRLATAQDTAAAPEPALHMETKAGDDEVEDTMAILENIRAMVPDFDARIQSLEAAESNKGMHPMATYATTSVTSVPGSRHVGITGDYPRSEPPQVPAKPARLLSASEIKQHLAAAPASLVTPVSLSPHTVTVTSQITDQQQQDEGGAVYADRHSARSAFFSSMQSPPTSPALVSESGKPPSSSSSSSRLPASMTTTVTAKASAASSSALSPSLPLPSSSSMMTSPSHSKPVSTVYYQAVSPTKSRSAFSSIPLPNRAEKDDSSKAKKVPPPPPPRTSSTKLYCSPLSPNGGGGVMGGVGGPFGRRNSGERSPDPRKKDAPALSVYKPSSPGSPGVKVGGGQRSGVSKFQKDLAAGIYANLNRPDLQHHKMAPDRLISAMSHPTPAPAAVVTNSQDLQEEGDLSGSESTGSSTSLDSQQGAALLRSNSSAGGGRGPKPNPPQRHSSLGSRGSLSEESGAKSKTQMLQERVRKSQEAGTSRRASGGALGQVNGVDISTRNGHKT